MQKVRDQGLKEIEKERIVYLDEDPKIFAKKWMNQQKKDMNYLEKNRKALYEFVKKNYSWEFVVKRCMRN